MSEKSYFEERPAVMLRSWVLSQMLRGAGYAALFVLAIGFGLYILYGIGLLLPPDSKTAPDPTPEAFLSAPASVLQA